jgi:hypothetical protein
VRTMFSVMETFFASTRPSKGPASEGPVPSITRVPPLALPDPVRAAMTSPALSALASKRYPSAAGP